MALVVEEVGVLDGGVSHQTKVHLRPCHAYAAEKSRQASPVCTRYSSMSRLLTSLGRGGGRDRLLEMRGKTVLPVPTRPLIRR